MKSLLKPSRLIAFALAGTALGAQAHTGYGTHSLMEGLSHPFGADHLLAMVAVGIWSVSALPAGKAWQGPATFMLALLLSAAAGMMGVTLPYLEHAISLSVLLFGVMLILAAKPMPPVIGLGLIGFASSLHGLAHGAETPESGLVGYAVGFLLTTAALHLGGVSVGLAIKRWLAERSGLALRGLGLALGGSGLYLFTQL
jgi:urease accessory protein